MRYLRAVLAGLALSGCADAGDSLSSAPYVLRSAVVWGMVNDASGTCIPGAVALVVRGQAAGQSVAQDTPCAAWDQEGGFVFTTLAPDVEMTIRVSAPGYVPLEKTVVPSGTYMGAVGVLVFVLAKQ
jgi:hypothetical protein